ncbi:hypothetical protein AV545_06155 [Paenibacillus jamilae]|uniref:hypothetical protein n=1 Tax=Paenibacillus jamilae TaxID=114136 RepID=UPI0007AB2F16|nr:hypothetical protein [Paenibacillus jamilae]KZE65505.1 hypothetical protein AV545_06155 [Paenibacillus jamilae]
MRGYCVFLIVCVLSGCALDRQSTPEQIFRRAVAGMAGKEKVTFTGQTGIRADGGLPTTKQFKYRGKLQNHDEMIMQWGSAEAFRKQGDYVALKKDKSGSGVTHERFLRQKGKWIVLASGDAPMVQNGLLNRFNPIQELEELNTLNKSIRMEKGAARGTWVVRIEPEAASAKRWLKERLMEEMNTLNPQFGVLKMQHTETNRELQQKLSQVWKQSCEDMNNQLEHSSVQAVYHLTIDRQTGLPLKLSSECRISRQVTNEELHQEALITRVVFEDYK